jgi:ubiquinone/menaquinone biosynthesis C-methylase UbiE
MEAKLQRRVQRYGWDKASGEYERYWRQQLEPAQTRLHALADLQPGEHVLDIACGTGLVTFPAARAVGSRGSVLGVDLSQDMVTRSTELAATLDIPQATFARMDAEDLQCEPQSFDAVLCALGLMYVPDPQKAAAEMFRVLRLGGRAVVAVWGARSRCGWAEIFPIVDRRVASEVCPMFFHMGTGDLLQQTMEAAGFANTRVERIETTLDYASPDEAIGAAFAGGPVALAYSRFDGATRDAAHIEYLDSIAAYRRGAGYAVPGEFVVVRADRDGV